MLHTIRNTLEEQLNKLLAYLCHVAMGSIVGVNHA